MSYCPHICHLPCLAALHGVANLTVSMMAVDERVTVVSLAGRECVCVLLYSSVICICGDGSDQQLYRWDCELFLQTDDCVCTEKNRKLVGYHTY